MENRSNFDRKKWAKNLAYFVLLPTLIALIVWLVFAMPHIIRNIGTQQVMIDSFSSFRVPEHWVLTEKGGILYFADRELEAEDTLEDVTLFMVRGRYMLQTLQEFHEDVEFSRRDEGVTVGLANYGANVYWINGIEVEKFRVSMGRSPRYFISIDESVTEDVVRNIALSYDWTVTVGIDTIFVSMLLVPIYFFILLVIVIIVGLIRRAKERRMLEAPDE